MPSIEIICIEEEKPSSLPEYSFAVDAETSLVSHRTPSPLFQRDFDLLKGCIYHLGDARCKDPEHRGPFSAYDLILDEEVQILHFLKFRPACVDEVRSLLAALLESSPAGSIFFTTDWQDGPEEMTRGGEISISEFWKMHDSNNLRFNRCYSVHEDS